MASAAKRRRGSSASKRPRAAPNATPDKPKRPRVIEVGEDGRHRHPIFSFAWADRAHDGAWAWLGQDGDAEELVEFMCEMSRLTWQEIRSQSAPGKGGTRRKHHAQPIESLCAEAKRRLEALRLDIAGEELFRFRLGGAKRLWGFEFEGVFMVLWWDPHHQVYPTEP